jgi:hypothetical protein
MNLPNYVIRLYITLASEETLGKKFLFYLFICTSIDVPVKAEIQNVGYM